MSPTFSTFGSNAPLAASDHDESMYLARGRSIHLVRISLSSLSLVLAVAAVACEGHPFSYYKSTVRYNEMWLSLWPEHLDLAPSIAIIMCGAILLATNLAYIALALLPSPRSRVRLLNYFMTAIALSGFVATVTAVAVSIVAYNPKISDSGAQLGQTLRSWSCTWSYADGTDAEGANIKPVPKFDGLCKETRASFGIMCVLIVIQFLSCVSAGCGWWLEVEVEKKRRCALEGEKKCGGV